MFDTITGLPVHALVVHGVVVLLPLMALVSVAVAVRPAWRPAARWVVVADALVLVVSVVARQSGLALQGRLGDVAQDHAKYGKVLPLFALALLVAAALVWYAVPRGGTLLTVAIVLVVVAAGAAAGWTVLTGDSGARAVWEQTILNTKPAGDG